MKIHIIFDPEEDSKKRVLQMVEDSFKQNDSSKKNFCSECNKDIFAEYRDPAVAQNVVNYSLKKYGCVLCYHCQ